MKKLLPFLVLLSCFYLDEVTQPSSVTIGERFTVTVNGSSNQEAIIPGWQ